jgi:NAD(P) transhydrogenase subunit alpha
MAVQHRRQFVLPSAVMTAAAIVALYLIGLAAFLGMDILGKVPPVMFTFIVAGLGAVSALGFCLPLGLGLRGQSTWLGDASLALAGLAVGGAVVVLGRLPRAYNKGESQ